MGWLEGARGWRGSGCCCGFGGAFELAACSEHRADFVVGAGGATGFACASAVEDEQVGELAPGVLGELGDEVAFDHRDGCVLGCEVEAFGDSFDVGVDDDAGVDAEGVSEDDVGGFAGDSSEGEEFFHRARDLAAEALADGGHGLVDGEGFVAEEAEGLDEGLDFSGG